MNKRNVRATAIRMNKLKYTDDMPRVSVVFDRRGKASDTIAGTVEVLVYAPRERARKYISTGVRVCAREWSDMYWVVGRSDAAQLNKEIKDQVDRCVEVLKASPTLSQDMKTEKDDAGFLDWLYDSILKCKLADGTKKHHWVMYRDLQAWGKIRQFKDVRSDRLKSYVQHVVDTGVDQQTVYGYWKRLRKWLNMAIEERKLPMDCYLGVHVEKGQSKEREFLEDNEIEILKTAIVPSLHLSEVRDRALVQMGCGLAWSDFASCDFRKMVRMGECWTLHGRRAKTGEQFFTVVMPWAVEVLQKWEYRLPAISLDKYNEYLDELCKVVGIDKHVTSHVLRHTYACYCLRHGVRMEAVSRALGHTKLSTTQIYARLVDNDVVNEFAKMK